MNGWKYFWYDALFCSLQKLRLRIISKRKKLKKLNRNPGVNNETGYPYSKSVHRLSKIRNELRIQAIMNNEPEYQYSTANHRKSIHEGVYKWVKRLSARITLCINSSCRMASRHSKYTVMFPWYLRKQMPLLIYWLFCRRFCNRKKF